MKQAICQVNNIAAAKNIIILIWKVFNLTEVKDENL